jgi:putative membrane protein
VSLAGSLALANAVLSVATIVFAALAYRAIRRRRDITRHRNFMLAAVGCSAGFLALFVYRFVVFGFAPYDGGGAGKVVYYIVLFAHEPIAVISVPLVLTAMVLGLRRSVSHVEIARTALVIWMVSALTGVALYAMLYIV